MDIEQIRPTRIFLTGMMGSGKSALGALVAAHYEYQLVDTDRLIAEMAGRSIPEIFSDGETVFREYERQVLDSVIAMRDIVVSTGGGMPCHLDGMERMLNAGLVLYLKVEAKMLHERLLRSKTVRPLLHVTDPMNTLKNLLRLREPVYSRANITVKLTADSKENNSRKIVQAIEEYLSQRNSDGA